MHNELIAYCGMNCSLCISYQFMEGDLNKHGFKRKYCPGCIPRGRNCLHMGNSCELLRDAKVRFCFECKDYPCKRLKNLDKRYSTKYNMSMIDNLEYIRNNSIEKFLEKEKDKWKCDKCGGSKCCHTGICLVCDIDRTKKHKENEIDINKYISAYTALLKEHDLQLAYRGIMSFMTELKKQMSEKHTDYHCGTLYPGYMDMTYFSFTPVLLKEKNLKIAVVYLHRERRFEVWLSGINRKAQKYYVELLGRIKNSKYSVSVIRPGVDSIIEMVIEPDPDFNYPQELIMKIGSEVTGFISDMNELVNLND